MIKPRLKQRINLTINNLGLNGEGVGKWHGFTVFVDGVLPEEIIKARLFEKHKNYGRAKIEELCVRSPDRIEPLCRWFLRCGGCHLMHLKYQKQLDFKTLLVKEVLGREYFHLVQNCIASPLETHYRNKIILPIKDGILGFYARYSNEIVPIDKCLLHLEESEKILTILKEEIKNFPNKDKLRYLLLKCATNTNEALLIFVTFEKNVPLLPEMTHRVLEKCPNVVGVLQNVNASDGNIVLGDDFYLLYGRSFIVEKIADLNIRFGASSFFQVNVKQAENIYLKAVELADIGTNDVILDAFCGVGCIALIAAKRGGKVVFGVENVKEAIDFANINANKMGITNVHFYCDDVERWFENFHDNIDIIFLNPPRQGCDKSFLEKLCSLSIKKIIYISCNPSSLARDLRLITSYNYEVKMVQPYDMFPQTAHVETVVLLTAKSQNSSEL